MTDADPPRRLSLLFQLYLASTESRRFMTLALRGTGMTGEEYGIYSYFNANGPRTLSQAATDLGYPITTLASLIAPTIERGDLARRAHPTDRRARLLELSTPGHDRLDAAIPAFATAYRALLARLGTLEADTEAIYGALDALRTGIAVTNELLAGEAEDR